VVKKSNKKIANFWLLQKKSCSTTHK